MDDISNFCSRCGKKITRRVYPNNTCQSCYYYFLKGGTISTLPDEGNIAHDHRGYVVCHICGRSYKRLGSHIKGSHNMTIAEYKEAFGLCNNARTTESTYSSHMRALAYYYEMPKRLQKAGENTRIKAGETRLRYGKKSRLQEILNRSRRFNIKK